MRNLMLDNSFIHHLNGRLYHTDAKTRPAHTCTKKWMTLFSSISLFPSLSCSLFYGMRHGILEIIQTRAEYELSLLHSMETLKNTNKHYLFGECCRWCNKRSLSQKIRWNYIKTNEEGCLFIKQKALFASNVEVFIENYANSEVVYLYTKRNNKIGNKHEIWIETCFFVRLDKFPTYFQVHFLFLVKNYLHTQATTISTSDNNLFFFWVIPKSIFDCW